MKNYYVFGNISVRVRIDAESEQEAINKANILLEKAKSTNVDELEGFYSDIEYNTLKFQSASDSEDLGEEF